MNSNSNNEGVIRKALIEADVIECILVLPANLFTNTPIPACVWFLTKNKKTKGEFRDRSGETLFIDARNLGYMKNRNLRDFSEQDSAKIAGAFHNWKRGADYEDEPGFCFSAKLNDIQKADFVLTPGRYISAVEEEGSGEPFAVKFTRLKVELDAQFVESADLEAKIKKNFEELGL